VRLATAVSFSVLLTCCSRKLKVMGLAVDGQQKEVIVDPNATVSSALTVVMQVFGFKNTSDSEKEESDEYGLVLPDGTWLDEMKKLGEFRQLLIVPNVLLKRKPWQLKVDLSSPISLALTDLSMHVLSGVVPWPHRRRNAIRSR